MFEIDGSVFLCNVLVDLVLGDVVEVVIEDVDVYDLFGVIVF